MNVSAKKRSPFTITRSLLLLHEITPEQIGLKFYLDVSQGSEKFKATFDPINQFLKICKY